MEPRSQGSHRHGSHQHGTPQRDQNDHRPHRAASRGPDRGDRGDRNAAPLATELFLRHRELAANAARRYAGSPHAADIRQVADVALWLAATRYRSERGAFEHFAAVTVSGEVKRYLRGAGWSLHVSRSRQEDVLRLGGVVDELTHRLGSAPSVDEVAGRTGWSVERVRDAYRCQGARHAIPEGAAPHPQSVPRDLDLGLVVGDLPEPERLIVRLTYEFEMTQREIGQLLDLTQSTVSRRLRAALARLREMLAADPGQLAPPVGVPLAASG